MQKKRFQVAIIMRLRKKVVCFILNGSRTTTTISQQHVETPFLRSLWIFNLLIPDQIYTRVSQTVTSFCYIWKTTFKSNEMSKQPSYFSVLKTLKHSITRQPVRVHKSSQKHRSFSRSRITSMLISE